MKRYVPHSSSQPGLDAPLARLCAVVAPGSKSIDVDPAEIPHLWKSAARHGLRPLLASALTRHHAALTSTVQADLFSLSATSLRFTHALLEIHTVFAAKGIRLLGYKGPALAALLHHNVAMREFFDIDVLIPAADVAAATDILKRIGYVGDQQLTQKQDRHFRSTASNFTFLHPTTRVSVELHWQIAMRYSGIAFDFEELWQRRIEVDLGNGHMVPTFSPPDQLQILAVHGARHFWESLCWLGDLACLLRENDVDFGLIWPRAKQLGLSGILAWALRLTHECFGGSHPSLLKEVSPAALDRAVALSYRRLNAEVVAPELTFAEHSAFAALLGSVPARFKYFSRLFLTPGPTDWTDQPLPERLHFAYPMLRISRVLRKSVRAAK
jgi:hypothetical protein